MKKINDLESIAKIYRRDLFEKFLIMKQGHVGSIFSMMEIAVTLYHCGFVKFDEKKKEFFDKVLISKGHATATLYPILKDFGVIPEEEWNNWGHKSSLLRVFGNTSIPGIDVTSGSLGHCIGVGAGMAVSFKKNASKKRKVMKGGGDNISSLELQTRLSDAEKESSKAKTISDKDGIPEPFRDIFIFRQSLTKLI